MRAFFFFAAWLLASLSAFGQTYFNNRYPIAAGYSGTTSLLLNGNGFVTVGKALLTQTAPNPDLFVAFFDSAGQLTHTRFFNRARAYTLYTGGHDALIRTRDGGMAMVGNMLDSTNRQCGVLWRFNAQGDTLWTRLFYGPFNMQLVNCCQLPNGDFILTGEQNLTAATTPTDALVMHTDSLGRNIRWRRTYHVQMKDVANRPLLTRDGGLLVTGSAVSSNNPFNRDWLLFKLDSTGRLQWRKVFGGPYSDSDGPLLPTPDGGYLVAGSLTARYVSPRSLSKTTLIKLDSTGQVQWERRYNPQGVLVGPISMRLLADGTYLLAGQGIDTIGWTAATGNPQGFMLNVCANGDSLWFRNFKGLGTQSQHYLACTRVTADGGFVSAGFLFAGPPQYPTQDLWLFKTDRYGYLQPGGSPPTVQCRQPTGLPETGATTPEVEIYPNPTLPDGRFTLEAPPGATGTLTDALGREVWRVANMGSAETVVDLSHHANGLYVLHVQTSNGRTLIRKLVR